MLDISEIMEIRNRQFARIRKAQMAIAIIDATITTDPRYVEQLNEYDGDVATAFPSLSEVLESDPMAQFN